MALKRVAAVVQTSTFGGPHNQLVKLKDPLRERGWELIAVLPDASGTGGQRLRGASIEVVETPLGRPRITAALGHHWKYAKGLAGDVTRLRRVFRELDVSVVQVAGVLNFQGAVAARADQRGVVWQLLSDLVPEPVRSMASVFPWAVADVIMTTGSRVARQHLFVRARAADTIGFFPPIDASACAAAAAKREGTRQRFGYSEADFVIGTVGNFSRQKNQGSLIRIFGEIVRSAPHTRLLLAGQNPPGQEAYFRREVLGSLSSLPPSAQECVRIMTPAGPVEDLIAAFDLLVLTSRAEGVPTVILEAMACGVPVASYDVGSIREVLEDGVNGILVAQGKSALLRSRILSLLDSPSDLQRLSTACVERARADFDLERCADLHAEAYDRACAARSG